MLLKRDKGSFITVLSTCAIELTLPTQYSDYNGCGTHTMYMIHYLLKCALSIFLINHKLSIISIHDQLLHLSFISIYNDLGDQIEFVYCRYLYSGVKSNRFVTDIIPIINIIYS